VGRLLNCTQIRNVVGRMLDERARQRLAVPSCVLDEDQVLRHGHLDLSRLTEPELYADFVEAASALRRLPRTKVVDRAWWAQRFSAVVAELRRRGRAA